MASRQSDLTVLKDSELANRHIWSLTKAKAPFLLAGFVGRT